MNLEDRKDFSDRYCRVCKQKLLKINMVMKNGILMVLITFVKDVTLSSTQKEDINKKNKAK